MGAPKWVADEYYDIAGKVAAEELAEWQKQTPGQHEMLNAMLRTMLEERCKLVIRQTTVDAPALALTLGKSGKLQESAPGAGLPVLGDASAWRTSDDSLSKRGGGAEASFYVCEGWGSGGEPDSAARP